MSDPVDTLGDHLRMQGGVIAVPSDLAERIIYGVEGRHDIENMEAVGFAGEPGEIATHSTAWALEQINGRIQWLRDRRAEVNEQVKEVRAELNAEIKRLLLQQEWLEQVVRLAQKMTQKLEGLGGDDSDEPTAPAE